MEYKNISPNIYKIYADDYLMILNITGRIQAKEKINQEDLYYYQLLTDHYIGKFYSTKTTKTLAKIWDYILEKLSKKYNIAPL